ncbi:MAG: hypothetical protein ACR2JB_15390 [Bryobacteraceae bacterium]
MWRAASIARVNNGRKLLCLLVALLFVTGSVRSEAVSVRYREGSVQGFLALRTLEGKVLAAGDLTQVIHGDRVVSHLVSRFKDGSVDDETAIFSQRGNFRLISDHHIQKGPIFPQPTDVSINALTGQVTVRHKDDKDHEKVDIDRLDLPPDIANGMILNVLKNISPDTKETKLSYVAATPKPRLVKLSVAPQGEETFSVAGAHHKATRFRVKVELGGIAGMIAPMVGKQPADTNVWVAGGEAPAFVKSEGPLYVGGPIWSTEMTSPVWRREPHADRSSQ